MAGSVLQGARARERPSIKVIGCLLLACVSALVAVPLYRQEVWFGSGPPAVTEWVGIALPWPLHFWATIIVEPVFFIIPGLALPAAIAFALDRRALCLTFLAMLLGFFVVHFVGGRALLGGDDLTPWELTHVKVQGAHTGFFNSGAIAVIAALTLVAWRRPGRNSG